MDGSSEETHESGKEGVVICVACTLPSIYLVCVVFGTAITTSLYIFGKCFPYLFVCLFVVPHYHTGGCFSLSSAPTPLVCMYVGVFVEKGLSPSKRRR